jgi:hypothetical protein
MEVPMNFKKIAFVLALVLSFGVLGQAAFAAQNNAGAGFSQDDTSYNTP